MNSHTGNITPAIEVEEHRSIGGVNAKATFPYSLPIALRMDDTTTTNVTYVGKAAIASATSAAVWHIFKIDETSGTVITWADGDANYDNVWDNRASLSYS